MPLLLQFVGRSQTPNGEGLFCSANLVPHAFLELPSRIALRRLEQEKIHPRISRKPVIDQILGCTESAQDGPTCVIGGKLFERKDGAIKTRSYAPPPSCACLGKFLAASTLKSGVLLRRHGFPAHKTLDDCSAFIVSEGVLNRANRSSVCSRSRKRKEVNRGTSFPRQGAASRSARRLDALWD